MFQPLTTERFELKQILPEDQQFIFEGLSHPQVILFYGISYSTFEATRAQMVYYDQLVYTGKGAWWKIVDKQTGERAGVIGFYCYMPQHNKAEIGYWLLPQFWKRGIISEALAAVVHFLINRKGVHRIEALVEEGNSASNAVLEKAGFVFEGTHRDCEIKDGRYISLRMYSLLSTDSNKGF